MADISTTGNPSLRALINSSGGTSGDFHVRDANLSSNIFSVGTGGDVTVTGSIGKAGGVELFNSSAGGSALASLFNSVLGTPTLRMEFIHDSGTTSAKIKASTSGYAMRVEGDTAELNTTNSTGTIADFLTNGTSRMTVTYESSKARIRSIVPIEIENAGAADKDIEVTASRHLILRFGTNGTGELKLMDPTNMNRMLSVTEAGVWTIRDSAGLGTVQFMPYDASVTTTSQIDVGNDGVRGVVKVWADRDATPQAGMLIFMPASGSGKTLYVYAKYNSGTGKTSLMINDADPFTSAANELPVAVWAGGAAVQGIW